MYRRLPAKAIPITCALLALSMGVTFLYKNMTRSGRIVSAVKKGDIATVRKLLDKHPELVNTCDSHYRAPLIYWAAMDGNEDICKLLIEHEADVAMADKYGMTALHKAAVFNHTRVMNILLDRYAPTHALGLKYGHVRVTPLHLAAEAGNVEAVKLLLERGADVNGKGGNCTPLHMAAGVGYEPHEEIVRILLDNGADINARDWDNRTPMSWAKHTKREKIMAILRAHGGIF